MPDGHGTQLGSLIWTGADIMVWGAATGGDSAKDIGVGARWRPGEQAWAPLALSPQGSGSGYEGTAGSQSLGADLATGHVVVHPLDLDGGIGRRPALVYDLGSDTWAATGVVIGGYNPTFSVVGGRVFVPDARTPIVGRIRP